MNHVIFVAADMFGMKLNYELEFPSQPSVSELIRHIEAVFTEENKAKQIFQPFRVGRLHVVDEVAEDWVEVLSQSHLKNACQVYAFQPHSTQLTEAQGHIPAATKPRFVPPALYNPPSASPVAPPSAPPVAPPSAVATLALPTTPGAAGGDPLRFLGEMTTVPAATQSPVGPRVTHPSLVGVEIPGVAQVRMLPQDASHDEKVRACFEGLDANVNRVLELDEMKKGFQMFGIDFPSNTVDNLFLKADCDNDGVVGFAEFQRFAELYPTLLDSLYYRLKSHWEIIAWKNELDLLAAQIPTLQDKERQAKAAFERVQRDAVEADARIQEADRAAADGVTKARASELAVQEVHRDVERLIRIRQDRERQLTEERVRERDLHAMSRQSALELENAQRKMSQVQAAMIEGEAAERKAAQMLADAQRDLARLRGVSEQTAADVEAASARHHRHLAEIDGKAVEDALILLQQSEADVAALEAKLKEVKASAAAAAALAADLARTQEEAIHASTVIKGSQDPVHNGWVEAQRDSEAHVRLVGEQEKLLAEEIARKRLLHSQEKNLVEEEVRLREQRDQLERKESNLRTAHTSFFKPGTSQPSQQRRYEY